MTANVPPRTPVSSVHWQDSLEAWVVTGMGACKFICSHEDIFVTEHSDFAGGSVIRGRRSVALLDGKEHQRVYSSLASYFAPDRVAKARHSIIGPIMARQADKLAKGEGAELSAEFSDLVAVPVIARLLGFAPDEDFLGCYERWNASLTPWVRTKGVHEGSRTLAQEAARDMTERMRPLVRYRRSHAADDLVSLLWQLGPALLDGWSEEDVLDQCRLLLLAGVEGVAQLICTVAYLVLEHESVGDAVARDRSRYLPRVVEEALRLYPPAQLRPRRSARRVTVAGTQVRPGDLVYPHVAAANLDPAWFPEPEKLRLDRSRPFRHLSFNVGPRHCIGASLSRAMALEAISVLLDRMPDICLRKGDTAPKLVGFRFRGFRPLYVHC